jgi:hypothetical protein
MPTDEKEAEELKHARTMQASDQTEVSGPLGFRIYRSSFFYAYHARRGPEERDYVVHFYPPAMMRFSPYAGIPETKDWPLADETHEAIERRWNDSEYWSRWFPMTLDLIAQEWFGASAPTLEAQHVPELVSWFFTARGMALCLMPEDRIQGFLERLDREMMKHAAELQSVFAAN